MGSQARVQFNQTLTAICLGLIIGTAGCATRPTKTEGKLPTATPTVKNSLSTAVNPQNPGPYKTVEINGAEMKQGRFPQGEYGGTLVQPGIASDPKTFNPWVSADSTSSKLGGYMFSGLLTTDPYSGDVIPDMAASYEVLPDHVTYITKLRKGLKWSDGKPITAQDVAFTFNTIVAQGYGNSSIRDVISVEGKPPVVTVVDPLTNKFVTSKPFAPFLRALSGVPIAPQHIIEPIIAGKDGRRKFDQLWSQSDAKPETMVTCGPFRLARFVPSQRVEFIRSDNYYMVDPSGKKNLPYLDRLVFLFVPDVMTNLLKFKGGETDITQVRNRDAAELQKDEAKGNYKLYNLGQDSGTVFMMFNMNQRKNAKGKPYVTPYKSAWFNDVNFRQAVNHALNRQQMVDGYFRGIGYPLYTSEPPVSVFANKSLQPISADQNYSMKLLEQSGFQKKADGKLYDKDGHLVEFDMLAGAGGTMNEAVGGFVTKDLKSLGMKVNFQQVEFNSLIDKIDSTKDWEACLFGMTGDPLEPNSGSNLWRSDGRLHVFDGREKDSSGKIVVTDARPWEKQLDDIFTRGVLEFDVANRHKIYDEYQQIAYDQAPFIYLISPMDIIAARNTLKNYDPTPLSQTAWGLHNVEEIWKSGSK